MSNLKEILKAIKLVAKEEGVHPSAVNKAMLNSYVEITEWELRKLGGLQNIVRANFPVEDKDLAVIEENKGRQAYVAKLEKLLGNKELQEQKVLEILSTKLKPIKPVKLVNFKKQKSKQKREIVMMLNDTHFGLVVKGDEVNDLNSYDWTEASRRVAMVIKEAIDFKPHTRNEVEKIHLVLNGDIIAGLIHGLNTQSLDLYVNQLNGTLHILTHALSQLLKHFKVVQVHGISGNHEDAVHKREGGNRVVTEKFDSYLNTVMYSLSAVFKDNKRVSFNFPKTPYLFFDLPGGRAMAAHGDTVFSKALGNPGTTINVKSLSEEIRKFNAGEVSRGKAPVKLVLFGHTHCFAHFITADGVEVYNAPSLSGTDGYAHSLNINHNFVGQLVFESTKNFILGDSRLIRVSHADKDASLDKIIPVFNRDLKWSK